MAGASAEDKRVLDSITDLDKKTVHHELVFDPDGSTYIPNRHVN